MQDSDQQLGPVAVVTSAESWFVPHAEALCRRIEDSGIGATLFHDHAAVPAEYPVVFLLSYFRLVDSEALAQRKHTLVVHASDLPRGRGWAPLFWQIIEGASRVPIVLFEASAGVDEGDIYLADRIDYEGHELNAALREQMADKMGELCLRFLREYDSLEATPQTGEATTYPRRTPADSELDPDKTLREQFDLLRTVHNTEYPAFFRLAGHTYVLRIEERPE